MIRLTFLSRLFAVPHSDAALAAAQVRALSRQVPLLLITLSVNAVAVAYTHYGIAPHGLTIPPLVAMLGLAAARILVWVRTLHRPLEGEAAFRRLRGTNLFGSALGVGFSIWAVLLTRYGDVASQMQVLFFLTITMIVCLTCLLHLSSAAPTVGIAALPVTLYFISTGEVLLVVTALNFAGVISAMIFLQKMGYGDFCRLTALIAENHDLAHTDPLTGLPNRRSFFAKLQQTIGEAGAAGATFAVGLVDLDGFKPVNDSFGHAAGDEVLIEVGERLAAILAGNGWAARLGGDEFGIIVEGTQDLDAIGRQICASLRRPYALREVTAQIGASVGFARFPDAASTSEMLVERADHALYHAKEGSRGTAICFALEHEAQLRSHAVIEQALRSADLETEFSLVYQPIMDVVEQRVDAYEALARWTSPTIGKVSPGDFIVVAERSGLIRDVTRALLRKALADMAAWPMEVSLSFNLSAHDIASSACRADIKDIVRESGVAPDRIIFELTETGLMRDLVDARDALSELKGLGVRIALDDFGTGYSSLSYVHKLPITRLKIDRSFVTSICEDQASLNIIRAIIDLARNLGFSCVIEGVETTDQMLLLRSAGCRFMQGYLFQKPLPREEIEALSGVAAAIVPQADQLRSVA
ncbi:putative bifunctional diguanylate cyclase/phosphodiesterase [Methylobacterium brachythecii]|uniref:Diguanylate cyclase (GGDEF)-like protein n=1 Tax=Methylobacterium brachythecii TaxID=1176177 RepID=A0A7W6AKG1_9HYPH|nr:EAL domain-containing protein [Methylobacterium brachythecii]MBB3903339.1 diguanylate cyclase (GGDEF)-like protein [Methylobacterium brachythecii]GLS45420.1 GGDEF-domain containing protein [Methylobacterium brachythecii]